MQVVYMRGIFTLNKIRTQDKIYVFIGTWLTYFTYHLVPVLAPNYRQHILSLSEVTKICSSLAELYVRCVYLNLFGWRRVGSS
jgi:hypothetical protein